MALKGNLRDFSTTQLLNLINLAKKTGTLSIEGQEGLAEMSFREGKLIYAYMGLDSTSHLAHILQNSGKLTEDQVRVIEANAKDKSDKQLGHLLITSGFVTQNDIIQSVRQYILEIVYKLFTWAEGLFRFDANRLPSRDHITIPIDLESVIMEGTRRMQEWEILHEELPNLDISLRFADQPGAKLRNIRLTNEEWHVVSYVKPTNTIRQIAKANNLSDFEIRRLVYGMLQAGLVEINRPANQNTAVSTSAKNQRSDSPTQTPEAKRSVVVRLIDRIRGL